MPGHIIEIAHDSRHLYKERGFLVVKSHEDQQEVGRFALDNTLALIANAHGLTYSNNILVALAERCIPFVLCGKNHNAVGHILPVEGHHLQAGRFDAQIAASQPVRKRLWKEVVTAKIRQQAKIIEAIGGKSARLNRLVTSVRSGDPDNCEAQAAQYYWPTLMGSKFKRERNSEGANALINYGSTVLRAATARAVVAAGLHPTLGIHHQNQSNAMRLVDDLMEPFRPIMEYSVYLVVNEGQTSVDADTKQALVKSLYTDLVGIEGKTPLVVCLQKLAISLAMVYTNIGSHLEIPAPWTPPMNSGKDGEH